MSKDLIPNDDDGFAVAENNGGQFIKDAMVKFIDTAPQGRATAVRNRDCERRYRA